MKREFSGVSKIFSFTLRQHVQGKGYKTITLVLGLLCLVLPALIMILTAGLGGEAETETMPDYVAGRITRVVVVDDGAQQEDYAVLNSLGDPDFSDVTYEMADSAEAASEQTRGSSDALVLCLREDTMGATLHVLLPEDSGLEEDDASPLSAVPGQRLFCCSGAKIRVGRDSAYGPDDAGSDGDHHGCGGSRGGASGRTCRPAGDFKYASAVLGDHGAVFYDIGLRTGRSELCADGKNLQAGGYLPGDGPARGDDAGQGPGHCPVRCYAAV